MKLAIGAVGRLKSGPERDLFERYRHRSDALSRGLGFSPLQVSEIPESRASRSSDRQVEEAAAFRSRGAGALLIAFDERSPSPESAAFAEHLRSWRDSGKPAVLFAIGGPDGLRRDLVEGSDLSVSFGRLTLPHQLVRVLVAEQIYRALTIIAGHPYHRDGGGTG